MRRIICLHGSDVPSVQIGTIRLLTEKAFATHGLRVCVCVCGGCVCVCVCLLFAINTVKISIKIISDCPAKTMNEMPLIRLIQQTFF